MFVPIIISITKLNITPFLVFEGFYGGGYNGFVVIRTFFLTTQKSNYIFEHTTSCKLECLIITHIQNILSWPQVTKATYVFREP